MAIGDTRQHDTMLVLLRAPKYWDLPTTVLVCDHDETNSLKVAQRQMATTSVNAQECVARRSSLQRSTRHEHKRRHSYCN